MKEITKLYIILFLIGFLFHGFMGGLGYWFPDRELLLAMILFIGCGIICCLIGKQDKEDDGR